MNEVDTSAYQNEIAVVGMACRLPGARNIDEFWQNLCQGVESIAFFSDQELVSSGLERAALSDPKYVKASAVLQDIELFDAAFFGFTPREAEITDPQHRVFLECAWESLESAGYDPGSYNGRIGVYAGSGMNAYLLSNLYAEHNFLETVGHLQAMIANEKDHLTTRVSYKLNLKGPSISLSTACSTSLVAIHLACQSLLNGECDMALAGGVSIRVPHNVGYLYQEGGIASPDGHCRAFDANAQGTVPGSGAGVVLLKRLADALADGDHIYAVVKGSAINNDGSVKVGYTAPGVEGQAEVIADAHAIAGIEPETITYIETHGTGTALGDPIELAALERVFRAADSKNTFCAIGSVKTNLGHVDAAAGVTGFIKTVLALKHELLPPSLHFDQPNPKIDFASSPFYVNTVLAEWKASSTRRRAGVSSFGIGGTNAHVVLEEAPITASSRETRPWHLLVLSARTSSALEAATTNLIEYLKQHDDLNLADIAYTLQVGRRDFACRRTLVCHDSADAVDALEKLDPKRVFTAIHEREMKSRPVVFLFPGQGSQYVNMALELYRLEPAFREQVDLCCELLKPHLGLDLRSVLYPTEEQVEDAKQQLNQTFITQPALFVIEYALARLWMRWGVHSQAMVGHSIGEYVAACLAGVFSLEDALALVATRGRMMQQLPAGAMLAIPLSEEEIRPLLNERLSLAAINGPSYCVVSGAIGAVDELEEQLVQRDVACRRLRTSHAFHSHMMDPIVDAFTEHVRSIDLRCPELPFISNVTGTWITAQEATDASYWASHLRQTVHFAGGLQVLLKGPERILLELGPGRTLSTLVRQHPDKKADQLVFPSLRHPQDRDSDMTFLLNTCGRLWLAGVQIDWAGFYTGEHRYRLPLPTYPFERQRYWIDPSQNGHTSRSRHRSQADRSEQGISPERGLDALEYASSSRALHARPALAIAYVAPRNEIEQALATIWQEMFGIDQIGMFDDFYEVGGDSLLATKLASRTCSTFQLEIPLARILELHTIAGLAELIEEMLIKKAEISGTQRIPRRAGQGPVPLSFAQQRLWFLDQLEPGNPFYNMHTMLRLSGSLVVQALERSLAEIVRRHESLRTTFVSVEDQPVQLIAPPASLQEFALFMIDLRMLTKEKQETQARCLAQQEGEQPFDLSRDRLLRVRLLRLGDEEYLLLLCIHHIVSDGWSNEVFLHELCTLYNAFAQGKTSPLPDLPIQYADFACWQRQQLQGEMLDAQVDYWRDRLSEGTPLELPTDRSRPPVQTFRGTTQALLLPASLKEGLKQLSQREGVTLFMTLLAAFQLLLARYSGQTDVSVGTPIANRTRTEFEGLIGFFVNTLVLRTDLSGNPSFRQMLTRVREVCLGAYAHQDVPFEKLVEVLQPDRDLSRSPLFQVMFILRNALPMHHRLMGMTLEQLEEESTRARFDLTLVMTDSDSGLHCMLEYNTDLFEADTISRLLGHWQMLLAAIVAQPEQRFAALPLLTSHEQYQLLHAWNDTARSFPDELCLPQLVEAQVIRTPEAIALSCGEEQITYAQLSERANAFARYLVARGVEPERLVVVLAERGIAFVVTILAIWKAGGVYLPLDPLHPPSRLAQILTQSGCAIVLTTDALRPRLQQALAAIPAVAHPAVLLLETLLAQTPDGVNLPDRCRPQQLAYVLYTSGSTGAPKGVMVEHRGMRNHIAAKSIDVQLSQADHVAQNGPQCFDISIWQCFAALLCGGRVHIFPDELALDPPRLLKEAESQAVTILQLVPSLLRELIYAIEACAADPPALSALRWLVPTGDALPTDLYRNWLRLYPGIPVLNTYGSTECSDDQCHYAITALKGEDWPAIMPIGTPIANLQAYVLDEWLGLVPVGVVGELYIGGIGVGRGYLNDPERTAAIFVPDPFGGEAGGRLYKTRDLARYRADGTLEFVGRVDHLVKVRGYRIELGEIEAVLEQHPQVSESIVSVYEGEGAGDKQLVAYVVPSQQPAPCVDELRSYLHGKLPNYMQPSHFVVLEALPLNSNGKVDRRALPIPDLNSVVGSAEMDEARTPIEEVIAGIWGELLQRKQVGIHDNFFALGGHSLLATQLISRIRAVLQAEVPLRGLFEAPTVAGLARWVEQALNSERGVEIPPPVPVSREQDLPLSFAQQRLWFLDQLVPNSAFYNTPRSVRLSGRLHVMALEQSLNEIIRRHEALRTTFVSKEGQAVQVILPPRPMILSVVSLEELPESARQVQTRRLVDEEARQRFELAHDLPMRMTLLRLDEEEHVLLLTMHHIISDDWSTNLFFQELTALYDAYISGKPSPLSELPIQYADFAAWQRQWLKGEALQSQLSYWRRKLADAPAFLKLPGDHPRPPIQSFQGARHKFAFSKTLSEALKAVSRREGATLFMTLLAAFKVLLYYYTGQDDIIVGSPIANRVRVEIEALIGCFFNTLALRTSLVGNPDFQELLGRVRETALGAYAHQNLPFEEVVRDLKLQPDLSRNPLFQVMFSLHNAPMPALELPNLSLKPLEVAVETVRLDLTLHMMDTDDGLSGMVDYNTDLFEASTIRRMIEHLEVLLDTIVAQADARLNVLTGILSELDKQQWISKEKEYKDVALQKLRSTKRKGVRKPELIGENT